jgi:hypothetical protein
LALQAGVDAEMPPRISFDDFDTEAPENVNDEDLDASTTDLRPRPKEEVTTSSIQLILLGSLRTRHRIVQRLNGLSAEINYEDVLSLHSELSRCFEAITVLLRSNGNLSITPFHRNMLDYLTRCFLLHLHLPFSVEASTNPLLFFSRKVTIDTSLALLAPDPDASFLRVLSRGGGLFRYANRHAGIPLALELLSLTTTQGAQGTLRRAPEYRQLIKRALAMLIAQCADRISRGETNVKNHMFLSMVMAQAESVEEGGQCDVAIATAARDSLAHCYGLLKIQAGSMVVDGREKNSAEPAESGLVGWDRDMEDLFVDFDMGDFWRVG